MAVGTAALIAGSLLSAGLGASGGASAGRAARKAGKFEGDVYDFNADVLDLQAKDTLARGLEEERRVRSSGRQLIGSQRAALAASGVDVGSGSAADVQADSAAISELDALTIRNNAKRAAWGFNVQSTEARMNARTARAGGRAAQRQGNLNAATSVLSGGIQAAQLHREYK